MRQYYAAVLMHEYNVSVLNTKTNAILQHHLALYYLYTLSHLIGSVNSPLFGTCPCNPGLQNYKYVTQGSEMLVT